MKYNSQEPEPERLPVPASTETDAEKFEQALQAIFSAPKEDVVDYMTQKKNLKRQEFKKQTEQK